MVLRFYYFKIFFFYILFIFQNLEENVSKLNSFKSFFLKYEYIENMNNYK